MVDNVKARKLYVGNLPLEMNVNEATMQEFFNTAMLAAFPELKATGPANTTPVESVWMNAEKKFCFVTFRNEEEALKGMQLDNIQLMGRSLRIGRPSDYVPPAGGGGAVGTSTNSIPLGGAVAGGAVAGSAPTTVVRLANAVTQAEIEDPEEYEEILEDMKEECAK